MAHSSEQGFIMSQPGALKSLLASVCVVSLVVGLILFCRLTSKEKSTAQLSCGSCVCHCSSQTHTEFSLPPGLLNSKHSDCDKNDPDVKEELKKNIVALLSEEIALQKVVSNDMMERSKTRRKYIQRASSNFRTKTDKCHAQVETCEKARERAEAALREELKLTAFWKKRARQLGWNKY